MELLKRTTVFRIEQQTKDIPPEDVTDISLSDVPLLADRLTCFTTLTHLTLVSMKPKIKTLLSIPLATFPALRMLDVSDNAIAVAEDLPTCPGMKKLFVANNNIAEWAELERLAAAFPELEVLDATDNKVDEASRFGDIFALFPRLAALDSKCRTGEEVVVADTDESSSSSEEDEETTDSFISAGEEEEKEEEREKDNKRPRQQQLDGESSSDECKAPPAKAARKE
ncbi:hypothetical protein DQ04_01801090 [Trypanosoma grayi]|uniref:hypothetical protein n=1 Tax=Trypanosoma grayi TaxID=71804 RepID=UPI0004F4861C|nr:hypothetical protein DQ04_01801090 [Trypanosoma grayi]KEG12324.1 hypothetical protein DQ04_01801090 [Trypanosoma grayi]